MAKMIRLVGAVKIPRGKKIPKVAKGWRLVSPGKFGFKAACESQFEHRGGKFVVLRVL